MGRAMMGWAMSIAALGIFAALAGTAEAQVIYQPVQYQYGPYVYYGGLYPQTTPAVTGLTVPDTPAIGPLSASLGLPTPEYHLTRYHLPQAGRYRPLIYTDLHPFDEAGKYGFTIDDARNEAYLNVARLQTSAYAHPVATMNPPAAAEPARPVYQPTAKQLRERAIPLLDWAQYPSARNNPELREALLREAAKYDPEATRQVREKLRQESRP